MRSESTEQIILIARIRHFHEGLIVYSVPNGGKRDPKEAARLKREGVLAGVPDVVLAAPRGRWHGLYIEMKRETGGRLSDAQTRIQAALVAEGYRVLTCHGVEEAYKAFLDYIGQGPFTAQRS